MRDRESLRRGGFPIYGAPLGIIMLDCSFPRPPGDIGNALTFPWPVQYELLEGTPAADLIWHGKKAAIESLVGAAKRLERKGVQAIVTSCGLLLRYQELLTGSVHIPVATSSLLLLPFLGALLPEGGKVGIITADVRGLDPELLKQRGWIHPGRLVLKGMEEYPHFRKAIMEPSSPFELDTKLLCEETLSVGRALLEEEPRVAAVLLECTNLAPYRNELAEALCLPVFDVISLAHLLYRGITVRDG